jgi:hypothetical protein
MGMELFSYMKTIIFNVWCLWSCFSEPMTMSYRILLNSWASVNGLPVSMEILLMWLRTLACLKQDPILTHIYEIRFLQWSNVWSQFIFVMQIWWMSEQLLLISVLDQKYWRYRGKTRFSCEEGIFFIIWKHSFLVFRDIKFYMFVV